MAARAKSYSEEQLDLMEEIDRRERTLIVQEFVQVGEAVGIDVVAEIIDGGKSVEEVFGAMIQRQRRYR